MFRIFSVLILSLVFSKLNDDEIIIDIKQPILPTQLSIRNQCVSITDKMSTQSNLSNADSTTSKSIVDEILNDLKKTITKTNSKSHTVASTACEANSIPKSNTEDNLNKTTLKSQIIGNEQAIITETNITPIISSAILRDSNLEKNKPQIKSQNDILNIESIIQPQTFSGYVAHEETTSVQILPTTATSNIPINKQTQISPKQLQTDNTSAIVRDINIVSAPITNPIRQKAMSRIITQPPQPQVQPVQTQEYNDYFFGNAHAYRPQAQAQSNRGTPNKALDATAPAFNPIG